MAEKFFLLYSLPANQAINPGAQVYLRQADCVAAAKRLAARPNDGYDHYVLEAKACIHRPPSAVRVTEYDPETVPCADQ